MSEFTEKLRAQIAAADHEHESNMSVPLRRQSYPEHFALGDLLETHTEEIAAVIERAERLQAALHEANHALVLCKLEGRSAVGHLEADWLGVEHARFDLRAALAALGETRLVPPPLVPGHP